MKTSAPMMPEQRGLWRDLVCHEPAHGIEALPVQKNAGLGIMTEVRKRLLLQVLQGTADANIRFDDLRALLNAIGFTERVKGSHHIFTKPEVAEILNLQPRGSFAKPYQVKQVRSVLVRYKLADRAE